MTTPHPDDPERHLPAHHAPLPELDDIAPAAISEARYLEVQQSAEFAELRRRFRRFAFPLSAAFLIWYFVYVLLSTYAVSFMSTPAIGNVSIGMLMGLAQFATTFAITWLYIRHANKSLDPIAASIRNDLEGSAK
jgi:uncharacterized membrane protein (DUF485 family)